MVQVVAIRAGRGMGGWGILRGGGKRGSGLSLGQFNYGEKNVKKVYNSARKGGCVRVSQTCMTGESLGGGPKSTSLGGKKKK